MRTKEESLFYLVLCLVGTIVVAVLFQAPTLLTSLGQPVGVTWLNFVPAFNAMTLAYVILAALSLFALIVVAISDN